MLVRVRRLVAAVVLLWSSAALAQVQVNQTFVPLGPASSSGPAETVQSNDNVPNGGTVAGAVQAILPNPALGPNTVFIGSPNGGIWSTTNFGAPNGGTVWTPLTDRQLSLSIASLGLDTTDTSGKTLIAGVGITSNGNWDNFNNPAPAGRGGLRTGLLYSTNGGATWSALGAAALAGQSVIGVAARGSTILAATFEAQAPAVTTSTATGAAYGLYLSANGGQSFALVAPSSGLPAGAVTALVADPSSSSTFYASITSPTDHKSAGVYVTTNSGATWTPVFTRTTPVSGGNVIDSATAQVVIKLATGPNGSVAIAALEGGDLKGLYLSQNSGAAWSRLATPVTNTEGQGNVNLALAIDPANTSTVYIAGDAGNDSPYYAPTFRVQGNTATSLTPSNGSNVHADARALVFDAAGNLLFGGDGGIYLRTNPQSDSGTWQGMNTSTLQIREPYAVAYGANAGRFIVAAQDTGVAIQSAPNSVFFNAIQPADGVNAVVSDTTFANQSVYYSSYYQFGQLGRLVLDSQGNRVSPGSLPYGVNVKCNGGQCENEVAGASDMNAFTTPFVLNRADPTRIAMAGTSVYVTQDMAPANATEVDLPLTHLGPTGGFVTTLAYGTMDNPNVVLAGNDAGPTGGRLFLSTTGQAGSITAASFLPAYLGSQPTSLVFDQRSQNRFYVADSINLWGTQNQGASITNLTASLPANITRPTGVEFINNNGVDALLVGGLTTVADAQSQIAVADSDAGGSLLNWRLFGAGVPNVLVSQMSYNSLADVLAISAVGRGVWALYDVTSYFAQATVLQFGLADNNSLPDASFLTDGMTLNGMVFSRPLVKYGTGTLTIAGAASYTGGTTIKDGVLALGTGGAGGSILGDVAFCANAADPSCNPSTGKFLLFDRSDSYAFAGAISGPGQVVQAGSGQTILTGASTYSGPTTVLGGLLSVNGSITSSVFVEAGGALGGNGSVGSTTILAGAMLSPGNSVGTLTVNGNLVLSAASLYMVEVQGNAADRVNVTGTATLAGTVGVAYLGGNLANSYTIVSAAAGLTGTFDALTAVNLPSFVTASLAYTATGAQGT